MFSHFILWVAYGLVLSFQQASIFPLLLTNLTWGYKSKTKSIFASCVFLSTLFWLLEHLVGGQSFLEGMVG